MWRLTSADKGRTNTVASFRHGGKNQTGVALAAKVLPRAAAQKPSCGSKQSHSGCRCFPHKQTHKRATLFLVCCPFFLMMLHTFFSHPLPLSFSSLSSCISSKLRVNNKSLNSVSSEAVSLIKSLILFCSQMSAACCLRMWGWRWKNSQLCACYTPVLCFLPFTGNHSEIKGLL